MRGRRGPRSWTAGVVEALDRSHSPPCENVAKPIGLAAPPPHHNATAGFSDGFTVFNNRSLLSTAQLCATGHCFRPVHLFTEAVAQHGAQITLRIGMRSACEAKCSFGCIVAGRVAVQQCC